MSDDRWEKRASEIYHDIYWSLQPEHQTPHAWMSGPWRNQGALQLAREAADARAEEIAKAIEAKGSCCSGNTPGPFIRHCAALARSTISKPERGVPDQPVTAAAWTPAGIDFLKRFASPPVEAAIRADERQKIAQLFESKPHAMECVHCARMIREMSKPKTREAALEEALRLMLGEHNGMTAHEILEKARRALDWKP